MPKLKAEPYFVIRASDLDKLVVKHSKASEFTCSLNASSSTCYRSSNVKKGHYIYDEDEFNEMAYRGHCDWDQVSTLLYYFCEKGIIPAGNYVVDFSW